MNYILSRQSHISYLLKRVHGLNKKLLETTPAEDLCYMSAIVHRLELLEIKLAVVAGEKSDVIPFVINEEKTILHFPSKEKFTSVNLALCVGEFMSFAMGNRDTNNLFSRIDVLRDSLPEEEILDCYYDEIIFCALVFLYSTPGLDPIAAMVASFSERAYLSAGMIEVPLCVQRVTTRSGASLLEEFYKKEISIFQYMTDKLMYGASYMAFDYATLASERLICGNC